MDFFLSDALANNGSQTGTFMNMSLFILMIVVFYFLLIRPQQKRAKEHKVMLNNLNKGDEVVTSGGLLGKIRSMDENFIKLEIASNLMVSVQKSQVLQLMPRGTFKESSKAN